jgi:putative oxygen-independent coproporphyrinogen III oxidase
VSIDPAKAAAPLAVYVHWPFCLSKCPYCDFNSHVAASIDQDRWAAAYARELVTYAGETAGRTVGSIFFGGGTPSLMAPASVAAVLDAIAALWPVAADVEITLEANPTSAEADRFAGFRAAGVNRLSLGVQALDDAALRRLGRGHSAAEARTAIDLAARTFPRGSFDLIYARPGQTTADWRRELDAAIGLARGHLSVYQLTIEPGTQYYRDAVPAADEDTGADLYDLTQERLAAAGLPAYEISNHARPGEACRHNVTIWQGGDYLGIGPGAHGRLTMRGAADAIRALHAPAKWLEAVERRSEGIADRQTLSLDDRAEELLLSGLRLSDGIDRVRFRALTGADVLAFVDADAVTSLTDAGFLVLDDRHLRATAAGRLRLNAVLASLLA